MSNLQKFEEDIFRRGEGERMRGFTHATSSVCQASFGLKARTLETGARSPEVLCTLLEGASREG